MNKSPAQRLTEFDRRLAHQVRSSATPYLDTAMSRLTKAANHSGVWLATAAALGLTGRRDGRRAALRGLLVVGLSSAATNGIAKRALRRRRPGAEFVGIRISARGASSSMPSGHAASAFAFATATAIEAPVAAVPVTLLAGAVAYSRVHSGAHYPGDVLAGAAIGTAVGLSTRWLWPVANREAALAPPAYTRASAEPSPDGAGLVVIVNPNAGSALSRDPVDIIRKELPAADIRIVEDGDDFDSMLAEAGRTAKAIGIAGGDGSVNAAAKVALDEDKPLAVFPGGTLNHFARALGLETVADAAIAVREGRAVAVDVGLIDGEPFLNTASFGCYSDLVDERERLEELVGKWPAALIALVKVLTNAPTCPVIIDGEKHHVSMIFIGNSEYEPAGLMPTRRGRLDDGLLDIRMVDEADPWARVRLVCAAFAGRLKPSSVYTSRLAREVHIDSMNGPLRLARDGETFDGSSHFAIKKSAKPLRVYGGAGT